MLGVSDLGLKDACLDVRDEPDGILRVAVHGDLTDDRARAVIGVLRRAAHDGRDVLVLADVRHTGSIPASARRISAEEMRTARIDAVAIVGASFPLRVVVTLLAKGVHILTGQLYPQQFFDTEGEARAWLLAQRDALRARRGPVA
ncbi:STAS/SEC14 domain-containing protein [Sorangium sp. So ce834]|uniref:STAS/SEC14 domain-containing protein n=1 Tax=Sorangium sp. So ce834 TaxID=3133321 RepID=UPI003F5F69FA